MGESGSSHGKVALPIPMSGTIGGLQVRSSATPGNSPNSYTFTVYVNGAPTAVTCVMTTAQSSCNDATHSVAIVPGDTVSLYRYANSGPNDASVTWSFYIDQ